MRLPLNVLYVSKRGRRELARAVLPTMLRRLGITVCIPRLPGMVVHPVPEIKLRDILAR